MSIKDELDFKDSKKTNTKYHIKLFILMKYRNGILKYIHKVWKLISPVSFYRFNVTIGKLKITYVTHIIFPVNSTNLDGREKYVKYTIFSTFLYICNSFNKKIGRKRNKVKIK